MIPFYKMHANGNDFIIIDSFHCTIPFPHSAIVRQLADRHRGVGFDQLLYLTQADKSSGADAACRIFNASGKEAAQCGHGMACLAQFLYRKKYITQAICRIALSSGICVIQNTPHQKALVDLECPVFEPQQIPFSSDQKRLLYPITVPGPLDTDLQHDILAIQRTQQKLLSQSVHPEAPDLLLHIFKSSTFLIGALRVGNPHCVVPVGDVKHLSKNLGKPLSKHPLFEKESNVEFMQIISSQHIKLSTYERGVGENQACGSGACAAVALGRVLGYLDTIVKVEFTSGDTVQVRWPETHSTIQLETATHVIFQGELSSWT